MSKLIRSCPQCSHKMSVPAPGKNVRCPHCKEVVVPAGDEVDTRTFDPLSTVNPSVVPRESAATRSYHAADAIRAEGPKSLGSIGRFTIRGFLGEGAFGAVYEAYDPQLDRAVAIKVAKLGRGDSDQRIKRFLREAKAAAGLRHPHIVPVYEFGQHEDQFFIVSSFIAGRTLQEAFAKNRKKKQPIPLDRAVRLIHHLAEALAYAHAHGIVHRDVKPGNVMLDDKDDPMLMDFGLATRQEKGEELTHAGSVLGTPLYMAPEQARGKRDKAIPASDQYSLGVMLYELIAGQPPFEGPPELVMFHHMESEPQSPRTHNPEVSRDLETICLKCLEKDPAQRYADCQTLARDLQRWRDGEPIQARPIGTAERLSKWCRRNPLSALLFGAVAASLVLGMLVSSGLAGWAFFEANRADGAARTAKTNEDTAKDNAKAAKLNEDKATEHANIAKSNENLANKRLDEIKAEQQRTAEQLKLTRLNLFNTQLLRVQQAVGRNQPLGLQLLHDATTCPKELRDFAWGYYHRECDRCLATIQGETLGYSPFSSIAISADGKLMAIAAVTMPGPNAVNEVKIWDFVTRREMEPLRGHAGTVRAIAFSPDGKTLAAASSSFPPLPGKSDEIKLWDMTTRKPRAVLPSKASPGTSLVSIAFSPDGRTLVAAIASPGGPKTNPQIVAWDPATGNETIRIDVVGFVRCLAIGPDSNTVALGCSVPGPNRVSGEIQIWDLTKKQVKTTLKRHTGSIASVVFSPNGEHLFSVSDGTIAGAPPLPTMIPTPMMPTGPGELKLWHLPSGKERAIYSEPDLALDALALSPDGSTLAAATISILAPPKGSDIQLWSLILDLKHETRLLATKGQTLKGHEGHVSSIAFSPDGNVLASAGSANGQAGGALKLWRIETAWETVALAENEDVTSQHDRALSPDGQRLAIRDMYGNIKVWDASTGQKLAAMKGAAGFYHYPTFSPNREFLAACGKDNWVRIWQCATQKEYAK